MTIISPRRRPRVVGAALGRSVAGASQRRRETFAAYLFLGPALVAFVVFFAIPAIMGLGLTFFDWDLVSSPEFVGLKNWQTLLNDKQAAASIRFTLLFVVLSVPLGIIAGLVLAMVVDGLPRGSAIYRAVFFTPVVSSMLAMSVVWASIFNTDLGLLNYALKLVGIPSVNWLGDPRISPLAVVIMSVWQSSGYVMLIYLAALRGIDDAYYEAAAIDGSSRWQMFRHITLPLLSPATFFVLVTSAISRLQAFEQVYVLTGGGPGYATTTLVYFIVQAAFTNFDAGRAATISLVLFVFIGLVTAIQWIFQKRWVHYD